MRLLVLAIICSSSLLAQNYTNDRKIDMHGGKHTSLGAYSSGNFRSTGMNMSSFLDKNVTKKVKKEKAKSQK